MTFDGHLILLHPIFVVEEPRHFPPSVSILVLILVLVSTPFAPHATLQGPPVHGPQSQFSALGKGGLLIP